MPLEPSAVEPANHLDDTASVESPSAGQAPSSVSSFPDTSQEPLIESFLFNSGRNKRRLAVLVTFLKSASDKAASALLDAERNKKYLNALVAFLKSGRDKAASALLNAERNKRYLTTLVAFLQKVADKADVFVRLTIIPASKDIYKLLCRSASMAWSQAKSHLTTNPSLKSSSSKNPDAGLDVVEQASSEPPNATSSQLFSDNCASSRNAEDAPKPRLWNPTAALLWGLLFSWVFSVVLLGLNWRTLGNRQGVTRCIYWLAAIIPYGILASILGSKSIFVTIAPWALYLAVAVCEYRPQAALLSHEFAGSYIRRKWAWPVAIGTCIMLFGLWQPSESLTEDQQSFSTTASSSKDMASPAPVSTTAQQQFPSSERRAGVLRLGSNQKVYLPDGYTSDSGLISDSMLCITNSVNKTYFSVSKKNRLKKVFESITPFEDGVAIAKTSDGHFIVNKDGDLITELKADKAYQFSEGLARFEADGREGFVDKNGTTKVQPILSPCMYHGGDIHCGRSVRRTLSGVLVTDVNGEVVRLFRHEQQSIYTQCGQFDNDHMLMHVDRGSNEDRFIVVNRQCEVVCEADIFSTLTVIGGFLDGWVVAQRGGGDIDDALARSATDLTILQKGVMHFSGRWIMCPKGEGQGIQEPSEDRVAFSVNKRWGYMDIEGGIVIPPQFESAGRFQNGVAVVSQGGKYGVIDKQGVFLIEPIYRRMGPSAEGYLYFEE